MQQEILLWCVAGPALCALVAAALAILAGRLGRDRSVRQTNRDAEARPDARPDAQFGDGAAVSTDWWPAAAQAVIGVIGWCTAVGVVLAGRQAVDWWPEEAWQQVLWPISIAAVALAFCIGNGAPWRDLRWLLAGLGAMATAMIAMPAGEGWSDLLGLHRSWGFAVAASALLNMWMLDSLARRGGDRWVLWVALAGLGGPMMLAASTYAGLAEWVLGATVATLVFALTATLVRWSYLWSVLYGSTLFAAAAVATTRFYTYEEHPLWLYAAALLNPSLIAAVDLPFRGRRTAVRVLIAVFVAIAILATVGWKLFGEDVSEY